MLSTYPFRSGGHQTDCDNQHDDTDPLTDFGLLLRQFFLPFFHLLGGIRMQPHGIIGSRWIVQENSRADVHEEKDNRQTTAHLEE